MAKVYLDANYFIDLVEGRREIKVGQFLSHTLFLSPISIHIYGYLYKVRIPDKNLRKLLEYFTIIPIDEKITVSSLEGPTTDFEDNLQLHSAAVADCSCFLTNDKNLLSLHFFGKTKIDRQI